MLGYKVRMFGRLVVEREDQTPIPINALRAQELLAYLLLYRDRTHVRDTIADTLWGESCPSQAQKIMRQALWQLQSVFSTDQDSANTSLVQLDNGWLHINSQLILQLDVAVFQQAFVLCQGTSGLYLDEQTVEALCNAADLCSGELLAGWYHDWCVFEREQLQNMYLAILDKLMDYFEAQGNFEQGIHYGVIALRRERYRECTYRRLMRLYYLAGDRTKALRLYDQCVQVLNEELSAGPATATQVLYQLMLADSFHSFPLSSSLEASNQPAPHHIPNILSQLQRLQHALVETQLRVEEDIQAVKRVLI